ncbi:hypothetical protein Tco_0274456 [Tanacetum coccineum]
MIYRRFLEDCQTYDKVDSKEREEANLAFPYSTAGRSSDAKGESHSLRITPTQDLREKLHHTRLRIRSGSVCSQDVETLPVRYEVRCVH